MQLEMTEGHDVTLKPSECHFQMATLVNIQEHPTAQQSNHLPTHSHTHTHLSLTELLKQIINTASTS